MPISADALREGVSFDDELVEACDLRGFDFSDKELADCTFQGVDLRETRWRGARLEACTFRDCDLTDATPGGLRVHGARFTGCKILGVSWSLESLAPDLAFDACNLRYGSFLKMSLRGARFVGCDAKETTFLDVDLTDADFEDTDLTGAVFERTTLTRADFTSARGAFLDPAKNKVKGAKVGAETALLLAASFGMKVPGVDTGIRAAPRRKR